MFSWYVNKYIKLHNNFNNIILYSRFVIHYSNIFSQTFLTLKLWHLQKASIYSSLSMFDFKYIELIEWTIYLGTQTADWSVNQTGSLLVVLLLLVCDWLLSCRLMKTVIFKVTAVRGPTFLSKLCSPTAKWVCEYICGHFMNWMRLSILCKENME